MLLESISGDFLKSLCMFLFRHANIGSYVQIAAHKLRELSSEISDFKPNLYKKPVI